MSLPYNCSMDQRGPHPELLKKGGGSWLPGEWTGMTSGKILSASLSQPEFLPNRAPCRQHAIPRSTGSMPSPQTPSYHVPPLARLTL